LLDGESCWGQSVCSGIGVVLPWMLAIVFQLQFFLLARLVRDIQSGLCGAVAKMKIVLGGWSWSRDPGLPQYGIE